jgi:hypothetical protein
MEEKPSVSTPAVLWCDMNVDALIRQVEDFMRANAQRPRAVRVYEAVLRLVDRGEDHLKVWSNIGEVVRRETGLAELATTFFLLSGVAHVEAAALEAAKLFDSHPDSANLAYLLNTLEADRKKKYLSADWPKVQPAVTAARQRLKQIEDVVGRIKQRRDQEIAHLDKRKVDLSPDWQAMEVNDIRQLFAVVNETCQELAVRVTAFQSIRRFSMHDLDPNGFQELIYFARAAFRSNDVESPSKRAESIRAFDRSFGDIRRETRDEKTGHQ